jgi:tetratricopeptide (TPR) repeat protein
MNRFGKRITGITLGTLVGLSFLSWRTADQTEDDTREAVLAESDKRARRRMRKGPRKPPTVSSLPAPVPAEPIGEDEPSEEEELEEAVQEDQTLTEQERKLEQYLEHLDAIDDPNVDELTMLGEMAFDANEAEAAYEHYLEVIEEHTDDPHAPFALYKLAWAEYNLGDVEAAIDDMTLVIEWVRDGETQMHEVLRSQGMKDLDVFGTQTD